METRQRRILVVDDDPSILALVGLQLELAGFVAEKAQNAVEAVGAVQENRPDLVILDVMMPPIDGIEVCRSLKRRAETMGVPVVMLSAYDTDANRERARDAGANAFMSKPYEVKELIGTVQRFLGDTRPERANVG